VRVLATDIASDGTETVTYYVPDGATTVWHLGVDTGQPAPPVEDFTDPVQVLLAELPAATLEEANDVLAQILDIIGGN
jgi:hypothetical protein